jgi:hypothetical protein
MGETARYLYAVTRDVEPAALCGLPALSGGTLEVLEHNGLLAVLSTVDLDEYGEDGLHANLEQLEWLEATARTHDAVIKTVSDHGPVAPMRLATIFLNDANVRRRLDEWFSALQQALDRVEGRLEWSVKILSADRAERPSAEGEARPASGAEYLRQKKEKAEQRVAQEADAYEQAGHIEDALLDRAIAVRVLPAQDPRLTGHQGTMVLNAAYLVDKAEGEAFVNDVNMQAALYPGLRVHVDGPWPPYSFAMLEQR